MIRFFPYEVTLRGFRNVCCKRKLLISLSLNSAMNGYRIYEQYFTELMVSSRKISPTICFHDITVRATTFQDVDHAQESGVDFKCPAILCFENVCIVIDENKSRH